MFRQDKLLFLAPLVYNSQEPGGEKGSKKKRCDAGENKQESRPERHVRSGIDEGESSRYDDRRSKIGEKGKGSEVLDRSSEFACNNRSRRGSRHDKTHEQPLCQNGIAGKANDQDICCETKEKLGKKDESMPFMEAQVERIHFAESEEKHKENEPREYWSERQEEFITQCTDEHREPEGVGVKEFFQIHNSQFTIYNFPIERRWSP